MVGVNQGCDDMKDKIRILVIEGEALSTVVMPRLLILDGIFRRAAAFGRKPCKFSPVLGFASAPSNFQSVPNTSRLSAGCHSVWKLLPGTTPSPCGGNAAKHHRNCGVFLVSDPCACEHKHGIGPNPFLDNRLSKTASFLLALKQESIRNVMG
jgi:hypothetical protein